MRPVALLSQTSNNRAVTILLYPPSNLAISPSRHLAMHCLLSSKIPVVTHTLPLTIGVSILSFSGNPISRPLLNVLRQPSDALAVALSHDDRAHEDLDRPDALEGHLALSCGLVQAQLPAQLVLGHGVRVVDLVTKNHEGHLAQLLHRQEGVELGLGLGEPLEVLGVHEEHDAVDFGEVVSPQTAGCCSSSSTESAYFFSSFICRVSNVHTLLMATEIKRCEFHISNCQLFRCWIRRIVLAYEHVRIAPAMTASRPAGQTHWDAVWVGG